MMIMSHHDVEQTSRKQKWSRFGMENIDDVKNYNSIERPWLPSVVLRTQIVLQPYHADTRSGVFPVQGHRPAARSSAAVLRSRAAVCSSMAPIKAWMEAD